MSNDREQLQQALGQTAECPEMEQLGRYADGAVEPLQRASIEQHVAGCGHCQAELALLREFEAAEVRPEEQRPVEWIRARLQERAQELQGGAGKTESAPWWKAIFATPMLGRAALALGCLLILVSGSLYLRRGSAPVLNTGAGSGVEVMRSNDVVLVAPRGDLAAAPTSFEWQAVPGATRYQAQIMEVDGNELWKGETAGIRIAIPDAVRARMAPAKSLLWQVTAFDASGHRIGSSNPEKFRLSPQSVGQ